MEEEASDFFEEDIYYSTTEATVKKDGSSKLLRVMRFSGDYRGTFCSWSKDGMKMTLPSEHEACVKFLEDVCEEEGRSFKADDLL